MENTKIKISSIVESQLPLFVREEYPLVTELLTEYYRSLEFKGSSYDILQNIDQYVKVNNLTNLVENATLSSNVEFSDTTINVVSTNGFPNTYGLIYINSEIILYKSKTDTSFNECIRGFSGITEFSVGNTEDLVFDTTQISEHSSGSQVKNLSSLFLKEFFLKTKKQFLYGFDNRELYSGLNQELFLKQSKDFYTSKGTDRSFEILFRVLYGKDVEVILPRDYLIKPSSAEYRVTRNVVVEAIEGNIEQLVDKTIFQDQYNDIPKSFGTVTDVEKIIKNKKEYYILKLDYDFNKDINVFGTIFGSLEIHPTTVIIDNIDISSNNIIVDSTIGFPDSGELLIKVESGDILITYSGKTVNQFLNCEGITQFITSGTKVTLNTYAYGYSSGSKIKFRVTGVLSETESLDGGIYYEKEDTGRLISFGYEGTDVKDNNWIFNKTVKCDVLNFTDDGNFKYSIETYDDNGIYGGDSVEIDYINQETGRRETSIIAGSNVKLTTGSFPGKKFQIITNGISISNIFTVKRLVSKFSNNFVSDVLNVYKDYNNQNVYVTSSSLPFYGNEPNLDIKDFKIILSGSFSGEILQIVNDGQYHGFITGDAVVYNSESTSENLNILPGVYYVKKVDDTKIKLSTSRSGINSQKFISIASTSLSVSSNNTLSLLSFTKKNNVPSTIDSQNLVRVISTPVNTKEKYETTSGTTGILINGVEILNYKSEDVIYYGPIKSVDIISQGSSYDIINPPVLEILPVNNSLTQAQGYCGVEGYLEKINILDKGSDYLETPEIKITGGGGAGAKATVKTIDYDHYVDINSSSSNTNINLVTNIIGFSTYHKFKDGESIVYKTEGNIPIGGLTTDSKYYVNAINDYQISLHSRYEDSLSGIGTIDLTSYGVGNHKFVSAVRRKKINSILVTDSGSGYKNKKIVVSSSGINTSNNSIIAKGNPYITGETIYYYGGDVNIDGLTTGKYIVTNINDDEFKLSKIGIDSISEDFYYKTSQYVNLKSVGSGNHIFNYEPIQVTIKGKTGISTSSPIDISAKIQPVFRGKVTSVFLSDGGVGYGSSDIINYNKQPNYNLKIGSGAQLTPIVSNGKIIKVVVNQQGVNYNSPPDLVIKGFGTGAKITPVISNGKIVEVRVINEGSGYNQRDTIIDVVSPGIKCELRFYPQIWTINNFSRLLNSNKITSNDGVVYKGKNKNYGLQYTHLYAPRSLRKKVFSSNIENNNFQYKIDYNNDFDAKKYHSPLIGWAYDGNPIYGPYGYDSIENKTVRQIFSSYSDPIDNQENRPDKKTYPAGFFVEDFAFNNDGDLDESNGRFCITPEYPNGVYAYFMTLNSNISNSGVFAGDKVPKFPYIIGNTYKFNPIDFNFDIKSNQTDFDFNTGNLVRNTKPCNLLDKNSNYDYFLNSTEIQNKNLKITNTKKGSINSIKIISGGKDYNVGDRIVFDNQNSGGSGAASKVKYVKGKTVTGISQTSITISDVEFYPLPSSQNGNIIGFSSIPHGLKNNDFISIDSLSDYDVALENSFNASIETNTLILNSSIGDVSTTGIVTYFNVYGSLNYPAIRENDILTINSEDIKVLNIDESNSRIKVLREQNSTVSTSHTASSILYEKSRKLFITLDNGLKNKNYNINKQLYFNPKESLGIGTIVGLGYTITFSNPGVGLTNIIVPQKSIYIKDHKLETGDKLIYNTNSGIGITVSTNGINKFTLSNNSVLYAAKISNDLIGISTIKVGLGTTGNFVGISQTGSTLFFVGVGSGEYHSFTTNYDNISKGNIVKNTVTVSLGSTHNLKVNDTIFVEAYLGISTTIVVKYSDYHRKLIVNPRYFSSVDVDNNLITIIDHGYITGEKLIHTSISPSTGLEDQGIYYAIVYDKNRIRLSDSYYGATNQNKLVVNILSSSFGTLSQINPKIEIIKNQNVVFDLSDSSLSQVYSGIGRTSSFNFKLFTDKIFKNEYFSINDDGTPKIKKVGNIGIDSTANIQFKVDDNFPDKIYYNFIPTTNLSIKKELQTDDEILENNTIVFIKSNLNGRKIISGITSTTFSFEKNSLENINYSGSDQNYSYYTDSLNEFGEIKDIQMLSGGLYYEKLPSISSITSQKGSDAILLPQSTSIGKINAYTISDIGYEYSVDKTLKPSVKFPSILRVEPLTTIDSINVISPGLNYDVAPDLVVIDGVTNKVVDDIYLKYDLNRAKVDIIKNTNGLYNAEPRIIPINNSNGLGISSISYNSPTKIVTVFFTKQFSDPVTFPFSIGDNVFIEGVSIINSSDKGFNSKNYNYSSFPVVGVNTNLGGSGSSLQYSLTNYLSESEIPGTFDPINSSGRIISESSFPKFKTNLTKNSFIFGETVESESLSGKVLKYDLKNEYLTVELIKDFEIGPLIIGKSSRSQAFIKDVFSYNSFYNVDSSSVVKGVWNKEVGFLNNSLQRVQDSNYYQYFSYSIKSEIPIQEWNDIVNNLNHTLGFKKFSDLIINSNSESGISTDQNNGLFSAISDLNSIVDIDCIGDYDLVSENHFYINNDLTSDEIIFNSSILQDYSESIGNRVLIIDDISKDFNTSLLRTFVTSFNI